MKKTKYQRFMLAIKNKARNTRRLLSGDLEPDGYLKSEKKFKAKWGKYQNGGK